MRYLYDNHLGGIFFTNERLSFDDCYCDQCRDSDRLIGTFETLNELWNILKPECSIEGSGGYSLQYIFPIIVGEFNLPVDVPYESQDYKSQGFCSLSDKQILKLITSCTSD